MEPDNYSILYFILLMVFACAVVTVFVRGVFQGLRGDPVPQLLRQYGAVQRCPRAGCHTSNVAAARFCRRCGSALPPKMLSRA